MALAVEDSRRPATLLEKEHPFQVDHQKVIKVHLGNQIIATTKLVEDSPILPLQGAQTCAMLNKVRIWEH